MLRMRKICAMIHSYSKENEKEVIKVPYDYTKLRGRIKERFGTETAFAKAVHMNRTSLSLRLTGLREFTQGQILLFANVLEIPYCLIGDYFFTIKHSKTNKKGVK